MLHHRLTEFESTEEGCRMLRPGEHIWIPFLHAGYIIIEHVIIGHVEMLTAISMINLRFLPMPISHLTRGVSSALLLQEEGSAERLGSLSAGNTWVSGRGLVENRFRPAGGCALGKSGRTGSKGEPRGTLATGREPPIQIHGTMGGSGSQCSINPEPSRCRLWMRQSGEYV